MNYSEIKEERRRQKLKDKYSDKPYHVKWRMVRKVITPTTTVIQISTALLALALPAFGGYVLFGNWIYGFIAGGVLMTFLELIKRTVVNNTATTFFGSGKLSSSIIAVSLLIAASIVFSTLGTPILVHHFAPMPTKPDESELIKPFDVKRKEVTKYWNKAKEEALSKAKELHSQNNWKGTTVRAARDEVLSLNMQAASATDSLNSALAKIGAAQSIAIGQAWAEFKKATALKNIQKSNVGMWLGVVTLVLELCFLFCFGWLNYYDAQEAAYYGYITSQKGSKEVRKGSSKTPTNTQVQQKKEGSKPQQRKVVQGFRKEGDIVKDGNKFTIVCETQKGLKPYDSSSLSRLIRTTEGQPKNSYWLEMKQKLIQAKKG